jgi:hypothetical protein
MDNRNNRIAGSSSSALPWQRSVLRDRAGDGSNSARSRVLPSHLLTSSLPPRTPAARTPAAHTSALRPLASRLAANPFTALPASNPFAAPLPRSNPFTARSQASGSLRAPADGSSDEIQSEYDFYSASNGSVSSLESSKSESGYDASSEEGKRVTLRELLDKNSSDNSSSSASSSGSDSNDPAVQNLRSYWGPLNDYVKRSHFGRRG